METIREILNQTQTISNYWIFYIIVVSIFFGVTLGYLIREDNYDN